MAVEEKESFCSLHFSVYEVNIQFTEEKKFILLIYLIYNNWSGFEDFGKENRLYLEHKGRVEDARELSVLPRSRTASKDLSPSRCISPSNWNRIRLRHEQHV